MSRTQALVKETFDEYFDRLKDIAETVSELKSVLQVCDDAHKPHIRQLIDELEDELKQYAEDLRSGGTKILKRVA